MNLLLPVSFIVSLFASLTPAKSPERDLVTPAGTPAARLVWSDEFNRDGAPDSTSWTYDLGNLYDGWGNHELEHYTKSPENVRVKNGMLVIDAIKKDGKWTSARVKSQGLRNWTYGKIEFRARLPIGKGTWPALWMLGESIATKGWPRCGEIDIMEHVGRNPAIVQCAMHTQQMHGDTQNKQSKEVKTFNTEFHTYAADWKKDKIDFYIDNQWYYTYKPANMNEDEWPYNAPFFIIMNVAIGGDFGGEVDPALTTARMEVDYVRVYQ
jgi:beta-glucanase (GH16 family)